MNTWSHDISHPSYTHMYIYIYIYIYIHIYIYIYIYRICPRAGAWAWFSARRSARGPPERWVEVLGSKVNHLSIYLSLYLYLYLPLSLYIYIYIYYVYLYLSLSLYIYIYIHIRYNLSIDLSVYRSIYLSIYLSRGPRGLLVYGQSPYKHCGFRRVSLKHDIHFKGRNSQVRRKFPGKFEASNLSIGKMLVGKLGAPCAGRASGARDQTSPPPCQQPRERTETLKS